MEALIGLLALAKIVEVAYIIYRDYQKRTGRYFTGRNG